MKRKKKKALRQQNQLLIFWGHHPLCTQAQGPAHCKLQPKHFLLKFATSPLQLPDTVSELPFPPCSYSIPNFINLNIMSNRLNYPTHESWHALPENLIKAKFSVISKIHVVANDGSHDLNVKEVLTSSQHKSHCLYKLKEQLLLFIQNKRFQDSFLLRFTQFYCAQNRESAIVCNLFCNLIKMAYWDPHMLKKIKMKKIQETHGPILIKTYRDNRMSLLLYHYPRISYQKSVLFISKGDLCELSFCIRDSVHRMH